MLRWSTMSKKPPLIQTNPFLRNAVKREKAFLTNVSSSTSVETGRKTEAIARELQNPPSSAIKSRQRSG